MISLFSGIAYADDRSGTAADSPLTGKQILFLGDSLQTGYALSDYSLSWNGMLENTAGMRTVNSSVSGSTMCTGLTAGYGWNSGHSYSPIFVRDLPQGSFDIVLIDGGANDWYNALPIGDDPNSRDTGCLMGAINTTLDRVQAAYPTALILYTTAWDNNLVTNALRRTGDDYSLASMEVCAQRNIPCFAACDPEISGIYSQDIDFRRAYFRSTSDRWHLNDQGHALFYPVISDWLSEQLLENYLVDGFYDVPNHTWFAENVSEITELGLMYGMYANHFGPNVNTNRAMLITVLYRMSGSPDVNIQNHPFLDVPEQAYYSKAIAWAYENGILHGITEDTCAPTAPLTRQQLVAFLYRYGQISGDYDSKSLSHFSDCDQIESYSQDAMCWAVESGILSGVNGATLAPRDDATRAQLAAILTRFLKRYPVSPEAAFNP